MANIEKIVMEEMEKVRPILETCKSIYFKGSSNFNSTVEDIVKEACNNEFYTSVKDYALFLIVKKMSQYDTRITFFTLGGIIIYSFTTAIWSNFKIKQIDPKIEDSFIGFEDINKIIKIRWCFYTFDTKSRKDDISLTSADLFSMDDKETQKETFFELIQNIYDRINNEDNQFNSLLEEADKAFDDNDWNKALEILNELLTMYPEEYSFMNFKAKTLNELGELDSATRCLKIAFDKFYKNVGEINKSDKWDEDDKSFFSLAKQTEAEIFKNKELFLDSIRSYNDSIRYKIKDEEKQDLIDERNNIYELIMKDFKNFKYNLRKVIYVDSDLSFYNPTNIVPIEISKANTLKFPPSHPVPGQLYVGHPFKNELYFPIEDYENYLFESQVMELSWLLKSLGATKIKTEHIMGSSINSIQNNVSKTSEEKSTSVSGRGSGLIYSGEATSNKDISHNIYSENNTLSSNQIGKRMNIDGVFKPKYKPYIPNDLIWYEHNEIWQSLAKQRLEGGLESYNILLSTKNVEQVSERELKNIDTEYKMLLKGSAGAKIVKGHSEINFNSESSKSTDSLMDLKKKGTTELRIVVDFAPIEELTEIPPVLLKNENIIQPNLISDSDSKSEFSDAENEYIEEVKFNLEDDDVISDNERKLLNRLRDKLKISEERALEIENIILNKNGYTENELEFIEEIKFCIDDDGIVDDSEMRMLNRKRIKLNISEERGFELIENVKKSKGIT